MVRAGLGTSFGRCDVVKKLILVMLVATLAGISTVRALSFTSSKTIPVTYRNIKILVDGREAVSDKEPFIYNGSTFVPLRLIGESLGRTVNWDNATSTITITTDPNNVLLKSEPVPGAEITVEQGFEVVVKSAIIKTVTSDRGEFSFTLPKEELATLPDAIDLVVTITAKNAVGYALTDGASNRVIIRVKKANGPAYAFVVLWQTSMMKSTTNKGSFAINPKAQS